MDKGIIISEVGLRPYGGKGWMRSDKLPCPLCGKSDKAGVYFTEDSGIFNCMRCSYDTSLNKVLEEHGFAHLKQNKSLSVSNNRKLMDFNIGRELPVNEIELLPEKRLPIGFKRIYDDEYLNKRFFLPYHYDLFEVGVTNLDPKRKNCLVFKIFDRERRLVAWLARSKYSKKWHKNNLEKFKNGEAELILRYDNSPNTNFSSMLGGEIELTDKVRTVILVEGLFDKVNIDNKLRLHEEASIKCLFTFGDSIKYEQMDILALYKNIKYIYLLYDYGTIDNSKRYGLLLKERFPNKEIMVCQINRPDADPGNLTLKELIGVINDSREALDYTVNVINHVK